MKIMYIIHTNKYDGSNISLLNLVNGIVKNYEIIIVYPKEKNINNTIIEEFKKLGCKCIPARVSTSFNYFDSSKFKIIKFILRYLLIIVKKILFYKDLDIIIKNEKPDIIHSNTSVLQEGFIIAKKYNIPHIWHIREYQTKDFSMVIYPTMKSLIKKLKQSFTICISKDIQNHFDLSLDRKSFVIYNPILSKNYNFISHNNNDDYFLVANRLIPEKGIEDVLLAFSAFIKNYPKFKLVIAGFGSNDYVTFLKKYCNRLKIQNNVIFIGHSKNIYPLIKASKALIVASYYEGFGRMTAEANILGIPVIGRDTGGTKEILNLTKGGLKFININELSQNMEIIASKTDKEIYQIMKEPQDLAINLFSNEQHIKKVINLYKIITKE